MHTHTYMLLCKVLILYGYLLIIDYAQVFFDREKVGEGIGGSRKEAQYRAADCALQFMTRSENLHMHCDMHVFLFVK